MNDLRRPTFTIKPETGGYASCPCFTTTSTKRPISRPSSLRTEQPRSPANETNESRILFRANTESRRPTARSTVLTTRAIGFFVGVFIRAILKAGMHRTCALKIIEPFAGIPTPVSHSIHLDIDLQG